MLIVAKHKVIFDGGAIISEWVSLNKRKADEVCKERILHYSRIRIWDFS